MADIRPGMRILDLACGAGSQTIHAAIRVGLDGMVVASDISPTMLEHLRRNAAQAGLQNIETLECAADELDKTQPPAEAIACRCKTACHDHRNSLGNSGVAKSGRVSMPTAARPPRPMIRSITCCRRAAGNGTPASSASTAAASAGVRVAWLDTWPMRGGA
jgi:SAM-dependent methyltransferase